MKRLPLLSRDTKIKALVRYVKDEVFPLHEYGGEEYLNVMAEHRSRGRDVPLSCYLKARSGVCREHALFMHFALREMGVENYHVYALIRVDFGDGDVLIEDHAFNLIESEGDYWVVDAYSNRFNAYRFRDLLSPAGVTRKSRALGYQWAPILRDPGALLEATRVLEVHAFPRVWVPKGSAYRRLPLGGSCFDSAL